MSAAHIGALMPILAALLPIPAKVPRKAQQWHKYPGTCQSPERPDGVLGSWLWCGPDMAVVGVLGGNQQRGAHPLSLSSFLSFKFKKKNDFYPADGLRGAGAQGLDWVYLRLVHLQDHLA